MKTLPDWWEIPRQWPGETVFVIGGGPSVLEQKIDRLRGRRVIAINSSYQRAPFAQYLVAADDQWWREHKARLVFFGGKAVAPTESRQHCNLRRFVRKRYPPGPSLEPSRLSVKRTTFSAGINLAQLLGASRIVLLGADGKLGADGRSHHYDPHRWWKHKGDRWSLHRQELATFVEPMRRLGIEVINASPGSAWNLWPVMTLDDALAHVGRLEAA